MYRWLLLLVVWLFTGLWHVGIADEPAVVRVGRVSFPLSVVQFGLNSSLDYAAALGTQLSAEEKQALLEDTVSRFVGMGVIQNKLREAGRDSFTDEELAAYKTDAQNAYETVWQELYSRLLQQDESVTEEQVSLWLNGQGYTVDAFYEETLAQVRYLRILDLYCSDVTLTGSEVVQFYLDAFVEPDRALYAQDIPRYESEILGTGSEAFYTPEGYRYIKHILLAFPPGIREALDAISVQIDDAQTARQQAYDALAEAAAGGEDIAPFKAAYDERVQDIEDLTAALSAKMEEAIPALEEKTAEIRRRLDAGERFEALMAEYSVDSSLQSESEPGWLFHPQSERWAESFRAAAAALHAPGDVSKPVVTTAGVHIIRYMADAPGGIHKLTQEEQAALEQAAYQSKQLEKLESLLPDWAEDYDIMTDASLLTLPE